ncbi:MAG: hypothetical protein QGG53_15100 [Planctomycetota bacterium]|nr:hypothetical protein [Planctomycetota bacterium]
MIVLCPLIFSLAAEPISVSDDFQNAALTGWQSLKPAWKHVAPTKTDGRLQLGGPSDKELAASRITYIFKGGDWSDSMTGVTVQKFKGHWAGLCVRKGKAGFYEVCIHEQGGIMVRRQPHARVLARTQGPFNDGKTHRLEVVTIGPYLRIFVDGKLHTTITDNDFPSGKSGLMGHIVHAHFDDYVQTRDVPLNRGLFAVPSAKTDAWVFVPGKPFKLPIDLWNATIERRDVELVVYRAPGSESGDPGSPITRSKLQAAKGKTEHMLQMPAMVEGLHHLVVRLVARGYTHSSEMPLGIWGLPEADESVTDPFFPVGVYDKFNLGGDATFGRTYLHAICRDLRRHGLNTLLTGGVIRKPTVQQLDICKRYGIRVVLRIDAPAEDAVMKHPSVISCMFGDEPKLEAIDHYRKRYEEVYKKYPNLAVVSCLVGESAGSDAPNNPFRIWWQLKPRIRLVRFYPFRKNNYGLLNPITYKRMMSFPAAMKAFGISFETPWWYVAQTFGGNVTEESPDPYWRNPSGPEISAMVHTALAFGAKGILCYSYQNESVKRPALVTQKKLEANDEKYAAMSKIARLISKHKELLQKLKFGGTDARSSRFELLVVPVQSKEEKYVYLINQDTSRAIESKIELARSEAEQAVEIFSGEKKVLKAGQPHPSFSVMLPPGSAQVWRLKAKDK